MDQKERAAVQGYRGCGVQKPSARITGLWLIVMGAIRKYRC
ncbi:MAG: hypothetical protein ACLUVD_03015 [Mediterraneibacter faecis]